MAELSPLRRRMIEDMTIRNMSPATQRSRIISNFRISVTPTWNFGDAWDVPPIPPLLSPPNHTAGTALAKFFSIQIDFRWHPFRISTTGCEVANSVCSADAALRW